VTWDEVPQEQKREAGAIGTFVEKDPKHYVGDVGRSPTGTKREAKKLWLFLSLFTSIKQIILIQNIRLKNIGTR